MNTTDIVSNTSEIMSFNTNAIIDFLLSPALSGIGQEEGGAVAMPFESIYTTLAILVGVLLLIAVLLVFITANLINLVRVREGEEPFTTGGTIALTIRLLKNRYIAIAGNVVLLLVVASEMQHGPPGFDYTLNL